MGRYALVVDGVVDRVTISSPEIAAERGRIACSDAVGPGWLYDGTTFTPPPPQPAPVPEAVTPVQFRRALRQAGLYDAVAAYVATQDADTQDAWEYAVTIPRSDALVARAAAGLGQSDEQVDDLFRLAATL